MLGQPVLRYTIYEQIKADSEDLDDAIDRAFQFLVAKGLLVFDSDEEQAEMKLFLRIHVLKSNAALVYEFGAGRLVTPVALVRSRRFMYGDVSDLQVRKRYESEERRRFVFDTADYNLHEITAELRVFEVAKGGHVDFVSESCDEISAILERLLCARENKSKL